MPEHAVIIRFQFDGADLSPLFELEDRLEAAIVDAGAGEFDGNDVALDGTDSRLYMYGPDADRLFETVRPILETCPFMRGAQAIKQYGPPEDAVEEVTVAIGS